MTQCQNEFRSLCGVIDIKTNAQHWVPFWNFEDLHYRKDIFAKPPKLSYKIYKYLLYMKLFFYESKLTRQPCLTVKGYLGFRAKRNVLRLHFLAKIHMRVNLKRVCKLWVFSFYLDSLDANIQTSMEGGRFCRNPPASGRGTDFRQMRESVEKCWKGQKCVQREGKRLTLVTDLVLITAAPSNKTSQQLTERKACLLEFSLEHWHDRLQKNGHYESRPSRRHSPVMQECEECENMHNWTYSSLQYQTAGV